MARALTRGERLTATRVDAVAYTIPTDALESDGTFEWHDTTILIVEVSGGGVSGLGYSYTHRCAVDLVRCALAQDVVGCDLMDVARVHDAMLRRVRNLGRPGLASAAIAAVDAALWDAKARVLNRSLLALLGPVRREISVYGSGGFTSYPPDRLQRQLAGWAGDGIGMVKMKVGRDAAADRERVRLAREAIGTGVELFVDANGAYDRKQAAAQALVFAEHDVRWFEEPVSSDDLAGLRALRDRVPPPMEIAAGEYGWDVWYFRRMLEAQAVDVLQIDATRCAGVTGFLAAASVCDAFQMPLSAHTAPHLHAHLCCAASRARHVEYFHDHARIEAMVFDGALRPINGTLRPDLSRPGLGLELKRADVEQFRAA